VNHQNYGFNGDNISNKLIRATGQPARQIDAVSPRRIPSHPCDKVRGHQKLDNPDGGCGAPQLIGTAPVCFRSNVGGGRQGEANDEPFRAKARSRIRTCLTEPVCAKGLNGACQENHGETGDEKNHSPHRKPRDRNWPNCVTAMIYFALARGSGG
jgi:hypothetical protein